MTSTEYDYSVRARWFGPRDERPAVTGAKFLKTLDLLSGIDPLFTCWQVYRNLEIAEDDLPRLVPLAAAREDIAKIVESGIARNDFDKPTPADGYYAAATAGPRGPHRMAFSAWTHNQSCWLSFGEHYIAPDLSIVTYPLFKAALLAISTAWDAQWAYAKAYRNSAVKVPVNLVPGAPAYRIDAAQQVSIDPTFPKSGFHVPWIGYLSAQRAAGLTVEPGVLSERMPDGGLLMSATTERLDPMNPAHVRSARILAETLIACTA